MDANTMNARFRCVVAGACFSLALAGPARHGVGDDRSELSAQLEAATKHATEESYVLRYQFTKGERVCWTVKHLSTTEATMQGKTETTKSRTISTKVWEVQDVDAEGNVTLVHSVSDVDMWQKISDHPEVRYNSRTDATPPPQYMHVAKTIGTPIATVKISPAGKVLERNGSLPQANFGLGDITVPLPVEPVKIGQRWQTTSEILARRQDATKKRIKTRMVYTLKAVKTGIATIEVKTEVVTPVNDPRIQSQLVQQITNGEIRFDLDAGRILGREIDWDETVVGFNGSDSLMKYLARFTEEMQSVAETAQHTGASQR
jgi:hypothetical protein